MPRRGCLNMSIMFTFLKKHRVLFICLAVVLAAGAIVIGLVLREGQSKVPEDFSPFGRANFQMKEDSNIAYPPVNGIPIPTGEETLVDLDRAVLGDNCSWPQQQAKSWLQLTLWQEDELNAAGLPLFQPADPVTILFYILEEEPSSPAAFFYRGKYVLATVGGKPKEVLQPDYFISLFDSAQKCPGIDDINWKTIFSWLYYT